MNGPAAPVWVVYGSSLSAESSRWPWRRCGGAWVGELRRRMGGVVRLLNRSAWGWTSDDAVRAFGPRVLALQPDLVLFEFAVNDADARRNCPVERSTRNLEVMLDALAASRPAARAAVMITHPVAGPYARQRPCLAEHYALWRQTALRRGCLLVDLEPVWMGLLRGEPAHFAALVPDGLHPSAEAAAVIGPVVETALARDPPPR